jgi:uncharacterized membrane protein
MDLLNVIVVSALPFSELRGGIPLAVYYGFSIAEAYAAGVVGNLLPIPFLLLFLEQLRNFALRLRWISTVYLFFERRTEKRREIIDRYGYFGLLLFVAIPLPVTGAWTGSLISFLLKLNPLRAFLFITAGVLVAGVIVMATVMGLISIASFIKPGIGT